MNSNKALGQTIQSLGWILFILFLGLFFDSVFFAENYFEHSQWINNICVVFVFVYCYCKGTSRVREQLIYAFFIGVIGEYIFSLSLGMYSYRLGNIPHYIPFGHALVFLGVYSFSRKSKIRLNSKKINLFLTISIIVYSFVFLVFKNDVFGFVMTILVFCSLRKYPKEKLFYLTMYGVVVYAELIGTSLNTWSWPKLAFNTFEVLPSANPPSGICLFYYGLDRGTMSIYKRRHKETWARLKRIKAIEN
jgi:hypothetical protein